MAVRTTTQFKALYGTSGSLFPDNTTGDISEADVRAFGEDIADSFLNESDDPYTGPFPQATASGTDTYAATVSPAITAYATGQKFQIKFTNASSGVSTLNLNTLGAKKIFTNPTTQATTGDITAAQIYILIYDAALDTAAGGFLMIGGSGGGAVDSVNGQTGVVVLDAVDIDFTPAGNIAATDVQAAIVELDGETLNGRAVASTTGTAIAFAVPQFYASVGTPATGNVTLVTTGLVPGMVQVLYHDDSSEPTFPAEFARLSGFYVTNTLNIIYMHAISATRIEYMIFQEL